MILLKVQWIQLNFEYIFYKIIAVRVLNCFKRPNEGIKETGGIIDLLIQKDMRSSMIWDTNFRYAFYIL